jgi:hypothetical protein
MCQTMGTMATRLYANANYFSHLELNGSWHETTHLACWNGEQIVNGSIWHYKYTLQMVSAYCYCGHNFHCRKTICKSACIFIYLWGEGSKLVTWTLLLHGEWFKIKLQGWIITAEHLKQVSPSGSEYDDTYTLQSL